MKAIDGDRGIDNRIVYSITRGGNGILQVEPNSGIVYTTNILDREDPLIIKTGAIIIEIMVNMIVIYTLFTIVNTSNCIFSDIF